MGANKEDEKSEESSDEFISEGDCDLRGFNFREEDGDWLDVIEVAAHLDFVGHFIVDL